MGTEAKTFAACLLLIAFVVAGAALGKGGRRSAYVKAVFEEEYQAYLDAPRPADPLSSVTISPQMKRHLDNIIKLGPPVLPVLMDKLKETRSRNLAGTVFRITKKRFVTEEWPGRRLGNPAYKVNMYLRWWEAGSKGTSELFEERYRKWTEAQVPGGRTVLGYYRLIYDDAIKGVWMSKVEELEPARLFRAVQALGIAALPCMMEKVRQGDWDVLPMIAELTGEAAGRVEPSATRTVEDRARSCLQWWEDNKDWWTIPFPEPEAGPPEASGGEQPVEQKGQQAQE